MRVNRYVALATGLSRRDADRLAQEGKVRVNGKVVEVGYDVTAKDSVSLNGTTLTLPTFQTLVLNKPIGFVCSRQGQGSQTIYDLLPNSLHHLKPIGRLDKDSSGLLLMTNDGGLAHRLTHPKFVKRKIYEVTLNKGLAKKHLEMITQTGVTLEDGVSRIRLTSTNDDFREWTVVMHEGRNRQIRRTFATLGYTVKKLHRTNFGDYTLDGVATGTYKLL